MAGERGSFSISRYGYFFLLNHGYSLSGRGADGDSAGVSG